MLFSCFPRFASEYRLSRCNYRPHKCVNYLFLFSLFLFPPRRSTDWQKTEKKNRGHGACLFSFFQSVVRAGRTSRLADSFRRSTDCFSLLFRFRSERSALLRRSTDWHIRGPWAVAKGFQGLRFLRRSKDCCPPGPLFPLFFPSIFAWC